MKIEDLKRNPAFLAEWEKCGSFILAHLQDRIITLAVLHKCGEYSEAEASQSRALSQLLRDFEQLTAMPLPPAQKPKLKPLNSMTPISEKPQTKT